MPQRRFFLDTVDSTNERAFAALAAGTARHGDAHVARVQTAGRGRRGRGWTSERGGLYVSLVLLPREPVPGPAWTMLGGLAAMETASELGAAGLRLKWPNDVMAGAAKLAGALVETRGLDPARPHYVLGVGLNVAQREFPTELAQEREVTSLALLGADPDLERAERTLLHILAARAEAVDLGRLAPLARDWLTATGLSGRTVRVTAGEKETAGILAEVDLERGLTVVTPEGEARHIALERVRTLAAGDPPH